MLEEAWVARKALCLRRRRERSPRRPTANPSPFFQRALIRNDLPADDVHVERQRLIARSSNLDVVTFRGKGTTFDLISFEPANRWNALIESFNGGLRDECLTSHVFASIAEAQVMRDTWRVSRPKSGRIGSKPRSQIAS